MNKFSEARWKLLSIVLIGGFVAAVGAIAFAPTQVPQYATAQGVGYVPFRAVNTASITCDTTEPGFDYDRVTINGGSDFIVTSVVLHPLGVNEAADFVRVFALQVDGGTTKLLASVDITGSFAGPTARVSDIMGLDNLSGGKLPTTIAAVGAGTDDIRISIDCFAGNTTNLTFAAGSVEVYGWKLSGDTITVALTES